MNFNIRPGNLVFDMDEVLFNISPYMYKKVRLNWHEFFPYLRNLGPLPDKDILNRPNFLMTDWLLKDRLNIHEELYSAMKKVVDNVVYDLCFTEDMYDHIPPTPLARETLMNKKFMENPSIKSVTILTRYPTQHPEMLEAKKKIISKYFNHHKIHLLPLTSGQKKSDVLKKAGINWSLFIDDEIRNIKDLAENFDLNRREFMIPKMGYNTMPPELKVLIQEKGGTVSFYDKIS